MWWNVLLILVVLHSTAHQYMGFTKYGWYHGRSQAFTKENIRRLQVIQNKVLRSQTGKYHCRTPTVSLLKEAKDLSVHQLGAYHTLVTVARMLRTQQPEYFANWLNLRKQSAAGVFPLRQLNTINVECNLSTSRYGFSYQAAKLWNCHRRRGISIFFQILLKNG